MKEEDSLMKKSLSTKSRGFVSVYFLGFLLYLSSVSGVVLANDILRMKTITNLEEDEKYFIQERDYINQFKYDLANERINEDSESTDAAEIQGTTVYIDVQSENPEMIMIEFDPGSKHVIDYECVRY